MASRTCSMMLLGAAMFTAMYTRVVSGEASSDAIWHNKIPVALSEPAVDIDKDPNLLHRYAENAGTKIHYVTMGSNQKPLMVFLHGFPDFWYSWRNQIQAFSANYQVVALDLRGYDLSDRPEGVENYKFPVLLHDELLQSQLRVFPACAQSFRSNHEETHRCRDQMPGLACARNRGDPRLAKHD